MNDTNPFTRCTRERKRLPIIRKEHGSYLRLSGKRTAQGGFSIDFWRITYISLNVLFFGGAAVLFALWLKNILPTRKRRRNSSKERLSRCISG